MKRVLTKIKLLSLLILMFSMTNCQVEENGIKENSTIAKQIQITEKTFDELIMENEFKYVFQKLPYMNSTKQGKGFKLSNEDYEIANQPAKIIEHQNKIS